MSDNRPVGTDRTMRLRWLLVSLLTVACLLATVVLWVWGLELSRGVHEEVFELVAGLFITGGIGGLLTLMLNTINAAREKREAIRAIRRNAHADIVASYNQIKGIRRQLRAEAIRPHYSDPEACVLHGPYSELMLRLSTSQLQLESHLRLIEGNRSQYPEPEQLEKQLELAESYIGALVSEWEDKLGCFSEGSSPKLAEFVCLRCFVAEASRSFKPAFSKPIDEVLGILGLSLGA